VEREEAMPKDELLDQLAAVQGTRGIALYPSSCDYFDDFQQVPYDAVILNSRGISKTGRIGKVFCLNYDNNELLGRLTARNIRLSALLVIRDGCVEGGNYQCVQSDGFFGRMMPLINEPFCCFSDHHRKRLDVPADFIERDTPSFVERFLDHSDPLGRMRSFHVRLHPTTEADFVLGGIRVKVIRDSIWRSRRDSDLTVVKARGSEDKAVRFYLAGLLSSDAANPNILMCADPAAAIGPFLSEAERMGADRLTLRSIRNSCAEQIADELGQWQADYPREVTFYHLNAEDFRYFRSLNS